MKKVSLLILAAITAISVYSQKAYRYSLLSVEHISLNNKTQRWHVDSTDTVPDGEKEVLIITKHHISVYGESDTLVVLGEASEYGETDDRSYYYYNDAKLRNEKVGEVMMIFDQKEHYQFVQLVNLEQKSGIRIHLIRYLHDVRVFKNDD